MSQMANPDVPWLTMSFNEATLPLEFIPQNFHTCGPIVVDTAPVEAQDAELAAWLKQAPTVLVNLGSGATYTKQMALSMLDALIPLMNLTEVQILWKFRNNGEYSDDFLDKAKTYTSNGRLRVARWLKADTTSLLNTGDVVIYVNHGGASSYHEAVLYVPRRLFPAFELFTNALAELGFPKLFFRCGLTCTTLHRLPNISALACGQAKILLHCGSPMCLLRDS